MEDSESKVSMGKFDYTHWAWWIPVCILYVVIRLNIIDIPLDRDEGIFGYIGQLILNNGVPYRDVFEHILYSQKITLSDNLSEFYVYVSNIIKGDFVLIGAGIFLGVMNILRKDKQGYFVLGFIVFSLLGTIQGYAYRHYFAQLAPAVAVAGGFGFSRLIGTMRSTFQRRAGALLCGTLLFAVPLITYSGYYYKESPNEISRDMFGYNPFPESTVLAEFIARRTKPDDRVFILGSEADVSIMGWES